MTIHIIATGETASKWDGIGPSIGCNDAAKWGHPLDYLLLLNSPNQFEYSRAQTIIKTKVNKVYTNMPSIWEKYFNNCNRVMLRKWVTGEKLSKNYTYHSGTSPFVAISMAYSWGFNKIVLWGVDLVNHQRYGVGTAKHYQEVDKFRTFIKALRDVDVKVSVGSKGTALDSFTPVWEKETLSV
jgi:hypothetical protein